MASAHEGTVTTGFSIAMASRILFWMPRATRSGATTAAAFLSRFVRDEGKGWVHLDLAASYQKSGNELWATGAKGHGLRTIARWLKEVTQ